MVRLSSSVSEPSGYIACVPASGLAIERKSIKTVNASLCLVLPNSLQQMVLFCSESARKSP